MTILGYDRMEEGGWFIGKIKAMGQNNLWFKSTSENCTCISHNSSLQNSNQYSRVNLI